MSPAIDWTSRIFGVLVAALAIAGAVTSLYAVHASMPYNALHLPLERELAARVWLPEGWKFFTADARAANVAPWIRAEGRGWSPASLGPNGAASNAFGLSRAARAQGVEQGLLVQRVRDDAWRECEDGVALEDCLDRAPIAASAANIISSPTLCGTVGLVETAPVPWSWSRSKPRVRMKSRVLKLEVSC